MELPPKLAALEERLTRVMRGPEAIESQTFFKVARPLFAIARWRASMKSEALANLLALLKEEEKEKEEARQQTKQLADALDGALAEVTANVEALERVAIVRKRSPIAHAAWLRRVVGVLAIAHATVDLRRSGKEARQLARLAAHADPSALFAPLTPVQQTATTKQRQGEVFVSLEDHPEVEDVRLVDLELAAIDHLFAAARAETLVLGRRRRLLIAARQRLLEASAALPLDRSGVKARTRFVAREITRIDRLEAAGLDTDVSLLHQARQALTRRDPARLFASIAALDANALAASDREIARRTGRAIAGIVRQEDRGASAAKASVVQSAHEILGVVAEDVASAVDDARAEALERIGLGGSPSEREHARSLLEYLPADSDTDILRAAIAADGFFEVGGALAAVRIPEEERVLRLVKHPTQELVLMPADDVHDLRDAVIGDPRSILLDLATGRLFARRFVREEVRRSSRVVMRGEVRVYVLDGSGSMKGARARVRDAILIAELSTLIHRLESPGDMRCTLFYRYFNEELGLQTRVDSVKGARDAIRDVVSNERAGGTDIEKALLASLEQVAESRANDPDLARAQIVLVTDGEAPVDEAAIVSARDAIGGGPQRLPIGVSVIALGQENPALRGLVSRQRAKGEAAFYHFLDDDELKAITEGVLEDEPAIHSPQRWRWTVQSKHGKVEPASLAQMLDEETGGLLDDLERIDQERDHTALERLEEESQARRDVGLVDVDDGSGDGDRARIEALRKDRVALGARFARWFPDLGPATMTGGATTLPKPGTRERDDIDATCCALASVAEVVALLGGSETARQADAIELLERLLPDARLTPARYRSVLREHPGAIANSLAAARAAVAGPRPTRP